MRPSTEQLEETADANMFEMAQIHAMVLNVDDDDEDEGEAAKLN